MGKLKFGVSSIVLGKEQKTENLRYDSVEWGEATTIQDFFRAGGNPSSVKPTRCKFLYTAEKLFVLFENMEEKAHHRFYRQAAARPDLSKRSARLRSAAARTDPRLCRRLYRPSLGRGQAL